jgi:transposase
LAVRQRWLLWIYELERGAINDGELTAALSGLSLNSRKRVLAVMAGRQGFSERTVAENLDLSRTTVARYRRQFLSGGVDALLGRKVKARLADKEDFCKQLFSLLHEPPSLHGFNRTTWRLRDLQQSLAAKDYSVCLDVIREAIRKAGFRWRAAKVVLTSTDPKYREKLDRVRSVLSALQDDERFFSIDEYGPFAIKAKAGRVLTAPGEMPSVQQWQKSKGWLIATVALELSRNQITHFYSLKKNTSEIIRMTELLLAEYRTVKNLYLSWDAASWHMSKELRTFVEEHNSKQESFPKIELVPLPASAQFLNVVESVFSGMARAIIHNSDYPSVQAAKEAIDRYFKERNVHFAENPRRAGNSIWGKELVKASFDPASNCKDPSYR